MRPRARVGVGGRGEGAPATSARTAERRPGVADIPRQALADPPVGQSASRPGTPCSPGVPGLLFFLTLPFGARAHICRRAHIGNESNGVVVGYAMRSTCRDCN